MAYAILVGPEEVLEFSSGVTVLESSVVDLSAISIAGDCFAVPDLGGYTVTVFMRPATRQVGSNFCIEVFNVTTSTVEGRGFFNGIANVSGIPKQAAFVFFTVTDASHEFDLRVRVPVSPNVPNNVLSFEGAVGNPAYVIEIRQNTNPGAPVAGFAPGRTVIVAKSGGAATTIAAGLTLAAVLTPTPTAPVGVVVYPGLYAEVDPLVIPSNVAVQGVDEVRVAPTVGGGPVFTVAPDASLLSIRIEGDGSVGSVGVRVATAGLAANLFRLTVTNVETGFEIAGPGVIAIATHCQGDRLSGAVILSTAFEVSGGAILGGASLGAQGTAASLIGIVFSVTGSGSNANIQGFIAANFVEGMLCDDNGLLQISSLNMTGIGSEGLHIGPTASPVIRAIAVELGELLTRHIFIESASGHLDFASGFFDEEKINNAVGGELLLTGISERVGDEALVVLGEFHVGAPESPKESSFGQGDSTSRTMRVFTNDDLEIGTFIDRTAIAASPASSTFDIFQTVAMNNTIFFGADFEFQDIKIDIATALVLGGAALIWEFSNGAGWTAMRVMDTEADPPYAQFAQDTFQRIGERHVRFGDMTAFATQAVDGVTKFWVRARIVTAVITTIPVAEQIKMGPTRANINEDGLIECFGDAEFVMQIATVQQAAAADLAGAGASNANLNFSASVEVVALNNSLKNNALDGFAYVVTVPTGLDTSRPLIFVIAWKPSNGGAGDIQFQLFIVEAEEGEVLDGTLSETQIDTVVAVPGTTDELVTTEVQFEISDVTPGNVFCLALRRDGRGPNDPPDTYSGNCEIVQVGLAGRFWR